MITPNRRTLTLLLGALGLIALFSLFFRSTPTSTLSSVAEPIHQVWVDDEVLKGEVISSKIGNETIKYVLSHVRFRWTRAKWQAKAQACHLRLIIIRAELGRAAWRLLHTTMAKFPDKPTQDEQTALFSYIHLFARLYPCGECASHFRTILTIFPPQVSTRSSAAAWACHVHNEVNKTLKKDLFDCSKIGDFYDCGCAEEEEKGTGAKGAKPSEKQRIVSFTASNSRI